MRQALLVLVLLATAGSACAGATSRVRLPTVYEAGHFYARPVTRSGHALRLLVDTGGSGGSGLYQLTDKAVRRLGLTTHRCVLPTWQVTVIRPFAFAPGKALPAVADTPCGDVAFPGYHAAGSEDGVLGAGYLPYFIWTFDYPGQALWKEASGWKPRQGMHRLALGFPRNAAGHPTSGLARITVRIAGQPVDLLLDTGATARPTATGEKATRAPLVRGFGVTSYITTSVMNRWHREHPGWRMVRNGDRLFARWHARLIEVPRVTIAGWRVGPVWFTERPDHSFANLSRYMNGPIVGPAGANIFRHFVMTLDYPHQAAWFRCLKGCRSATAARRP
jgi:predicted aspartyl protease